MCKEYYVSVFLYQVYQARPEAAKEWRGLPSKPNIFLVLVEPDKLDIKRHMVFYLSCFISRFNDKMIAKQMKSKRCYFSQPQY